MDLKERLRRRIKEDPRWEVRIPPGRLLGELYDDLNLCRWDVLVDSVVETMDQIINKGEIE